MTEWIEQTVVLAVHEQQLSEHGGPSGIRDPGLLESALAPPRNRAAYGNADIFDLAAAYAFGLTRDHPFVDGNKRVSLVVTEIFLELNGCELTADDPDCLDKWMGLSDGTVSETEMAGWLRNHSSQI